MDKKSIRLLAIGVLSILLLVIGYIFSDHISEKNLGVDYDYERVIRSFIVILISVIVIRMLFLAIINPFEKRNNQKIPSILKYVIGVLVLLLSTIFIVTNIYSQSALIIFVGLGASGLGIAFIAQDFLKELFAGVTIAFQNDFRVGDWVKFPDGTIGRIIKTKLSGVDLRLLDDTQLYVGNTAITDQAMINLNQPSPSFFTGLNILLEHDIPIERARRILYSAVINVEGLASKDILVVADNIQQNGVLFSVFFKIPSFDVLREIKHRVISSIVRHLHKYDLKVCEISGQYEIKDIDVKFKKNFDDQYVTDKLTALKFSGLLKNCTKEVQEQFANRMEKLYFKKGDLICNQGDTGETMFIIAEGVVNVSINISVVEKNGETKSSSNIVATLSEGDYFGEMALLCGEKRTANIIAKTDVVLYEVNRETIKTFMKQYTDFAKQLSTAIIERNSQNEIAKTEAIDELNKKEDEISEFMKAFKTFLLSD